MQPQNKFRIVRRLLTAIGLSSEAVDDILERIEDFLSGEKDERAPHKPEYPYCTRDDFLSPAKHGFFMLLRSVVADSALISIKVGLGDLFCVRSSDASQHRIYTNKIDRKHVDFLLCDSKTIRPVVGIELDDKSHQRSDRQARDDFIENVFQAARLPLVRISVKHSYSTGELHAFLNPYLEQAGKHCQVHGLLLPTLSQHARNVEVLWFYEPQKAEQTRVKSSGDAQISPNVEAFSNMVNLPTDGLL